MSNEQKPAPEKRDDAPDFLARVFERTTVGGKDAVEGGGAIIPRKSVSFDIDGADCAPGIFVDAAGEPVTFKITLQSLLSGEEIKAIRGCTDPSEAAFMTARASIAAINGAPVNDPAHLEFLWEALGSGGRQLVVAMYQEVGAASPAGMGKALASRSR